MKKLSVLIAMVLVVALAVPTFAASFSDVPSNHWAYQAINKIVAAGIIEGYPDGTYKGQNDLTRYEIAVVVSRVLDKVAQERAALADEVDAAKDNLSTGEAQDVTAIVKSLMEKNMPEAQELPEGLTDKQAEQVSNLIEALTFEFQDELDTIGANVNAVNADVEDLKLRVAALENEEPVVSFSGSYAVDFVNQDIEVSDGVDEDVDYYWYNTTDQTALALEDQTISSPKKEKDDIVYTDPWDTDSDKIVVEDEGKVEQTLNFQADINKDGFAATINVDADEDEDELSIGSAALTLENDEIAGTYNSANTADIADYSFSAAEFNGVTVDFKDLGVDAFMGTKAYEVAGTAASADEDVKHDTHTVEQDVIKYDKDGTTYDAQNAEEDFYVFGAQKSFDLGGLELTANAVRRQARNDSFTDDFGNTVDELDELMNTNVLGLDAATGVAGADVSFDVAQSMPADDTKDDGSLVRFGVAKDLDLAGFEFNYKDRDKDFEPISEDGVVFDADDDDYDKFTTGLADKDMHGWNLTVQPFVVEDMVDGLDAEIFYASVEEENSTATYGEETKLSLTGEMPVLVDGLTVDGEYTVVDPEDDAVAPNDKKEKTYKIGAEYVINDYVTANVSYEDVSDVDFTDNDDKETTSYGIDVADYPLVGALTGSAGFSVEDIGADYDEETTEYNLGLGYTIGKADLSYDYINTEKEGTTVGDPGEATYTTNEFGLVYNLTADTDLTASYEILELDDKDDVDNYEVETAKAGVSISF